MQQVKWTERKFLLGYNKSYIPLFMERLRGTAPRLEEMVAGIDDATASAPDGSAWSIKQHIGHLSDLEHIHDGRIDDFIDGHPILRAADMTNKATYEADHNNRFVADLLAELRRVRSAFLDRIDDLDEEVYSAEAMHPRLQQMMSLADMLYFVAEHDNSHLCRIAAILRKK